MASYGFLPVWSYSRPIHTIDFGNRFPYGRNNSNIRALYRSGRIKARAFFRWEDKQISHLEEITGRLLKWKEDSHIPEPCVYENGKFTIKLRQHNVSHTLDPKTKTEVKGVSLEISPFGVNLMDEAWRHIQNSDYKLYWNIYETLYHEAENVCKIMEIIVGQYEHIVTSFIETSCPELKRTNIWAPPAVPYYYLDWRVFSLIFSEVSMHLEGQNGGMFEYRDTELEIVDEKGNRNKTMLTELWFIGSGIARGTQADMKRLEAVIHNLIEKQDIIKLVNDYLRLLQGSSQRNISIPNLDIELQRLEMRVRAGDIRGFRDLICDLCPPKQSSV